MKINVKSHHSASIEADIVTTRNIAANVVGKRRWYGDRLMIDLSRKNIEWLSSNYPQAEWSDSEPLKRAQEFNENPKCNMSAEEFDSFSFPWKLKPFKHQKEAFISAKDRDAFAYLMEMGTGKTKVGIDDASYQFSNGDIDTLLITAPNGVHRQWIDEQIPDHLPEWVDYSTLIYQSNQTKKWTADAEQALTCSRSKLLIISMHIDAFSTAKGIDFLNRVFKDRKVMWIFDESDGIKTPKAKRTKNILKAAKMAVKRRIMSGTPITKGIEDLFTQFYFLDPYIFDDKSFYRFRERFCILKPVPGNRFGAMRVTGYKNLDELKEIIAPHSYIVKKKDCLDLPEKTYMTRYVDLTAEQRRLYQEMKNHLIASLDDGTVISADMVMTSLLKLQQITCGHIKDEEGQIKKIDSNRVSVCMDILNEATGKVIIWARFQEDIINLSEALDKEGISFVEYTGRVNNQQRTDNIKRFRECNECRVFLANPQAAGTGLNLAVASTAIYYSNDFNASTRWQSEDRIHRIGQENKAVYIDMVARDTVDEKITKALKDKKDIADMILDVKKMLSI